jgi:hypothetical protein
MGHRPLVGVTTSEVRRAAGLVSVGCAPFVAGAIVPADGDTGLLCPFRELTGLPCPLCGATRAFALAARGDAGFLDYNAVWVVVAGLLVATGVAVLVTRRPVRLSTPLGAALAVALALAAWTYAFAQRAAIVG